MNSISKSLKSPKYLSTNPLKSDYEKEFNDLTSQYRNLEYRYTLLQQEKVNFCNYYCFNGYF